MLFRSRAIDVPKHLARMQVNAKNTKSGPAIEKEMIIAVKLVLVEPAGEEYVGVYTKLLYV